MRMTNRITNKNPARVQSRIPHIISVCKLSFQRVVTSSPRRNAAEGSVSQRLTEVTGTLPQFAPAGQEATAARLARHGLIGGKGAYDPWHGPCALPVVRQ